jgi:hypothetical protein
MERVGDQREAAEQQAADELDDEQRRVGGERELQRSATSSEGCVDVRNLRHRRAPHASDVTGRYEIRVEL